MRTHTRRRSVVLVPLLLLAPAAALATPSSIVWVNNTDTQPHGTLHLGMDNFVATGSGVAPLSADLGATLGLQPLPWLGLEVGADWWANAAAPLWLNAKLGTPEGRLRPAFAVGAYGMGLEEGAQNHVLYALAAKTLGPVGRVTIGGYHAVGAAPLFGGTPASSFGGERTGAIFAWERALNDKVWLAADLQTGNNAFAAASVGGAYKISPNASVLVGYNHMFAQGLPGTVYVALDADVNLFAGRARETVSEGSADGEKRPAPGTETVPSTGGAAVEPASSRSKDAPCPSAGAPEGNEQH